VLIKSLLGAVLAGVGATGAIITVQSLHPANPAKPHAAPAPSVRPQAPLAISARTSQSAVAPGMARHRMAQGHTEASARHPSHLRHAQAVRAATAAVIAHTRLHVRTLARAAAYHRTVRARRVTVWQVRQPRARVRARAARAHRALRPRTAALFRAQTARARGGLGSLAHPRAAHRTRPLGARSLSGRAGRR
jgi:hypothetical protein